MRIPRKLQIGVSGVFHKMWQGHNREHVLNDDMEKNTYLDCLAKAFTDEKKEKIQWHSYCIMGNHPHEVDRVLPDENGSLQASIECFSNWMRNGHSRYGTWYNIRHKRRGEVACDRPKTEELENEWKVLKEMFYCDANPVRAGMVSHPSRYPYSSHRYYAWGKTNRHTEHLTPPPGYFALGRTAEERRKKYRSLCDLYLRQAGLIADTPSDEPTTEELLKEAFVTALYRIDICGVPPP